MLNQLTFIGVLSGTDPEETTGNGRKYRRFTVTAERTFRGNVYQDTVDFTAWHDDALNEIASAKIGDIVYINGRVSSKPTQTGKRFIDLIATVFINYGKLRKDDEQIAGDQQADEELPF